MSAKRRMPDSPKRIGAAADHGRSESKEYLAGMLRESHYQAVDSGDSQPKPDDDYAESVATSRSRRGLSRRSHPR